MFSEKGLYRDRTSIFVFKKIMIFKFKTNDNHIHNKENRKSRQFFVIRQTYSFVTYFPFFKLFIDLLEDVQSNVFIYIINKKKSKNKPKFWNFENKNKYYEDKIKFKRLEIYTHNKTEEHEILNQIDSSIIKTVKFLNRLFILLFFTF